MAAQFALNAIGPALLLKHLHPLLPKTGRGVFATLSARVGSIGDNRLGGWISYRAAKAALNQIVRTAAGRDRPQAPARPSSSRCTPAPSRTPLTAQIPRPPPVGERRRPPPRNLLACSTASTPADTGGFFAWDGTPIPW